MADPPKLLDRIRIAVRARHYSIRTEEAYVAWARRYILFHGKKHPSAMGAEEVNAFLTHLVVDGGVSASTQSQALSALMLTSAGLRMWCDRRGRSGCLWFSRGKRSCAFWTECREWSG